MTKEKVASMHEHKKSRRRAASVLSLGAASLVAAVPFAHAAETADAKRGDVLEEIVVTAQFREERLQDAPIAITAISAATLESRGQSNINEIAAQAPNVTLKPSANSFGNSMTASIRGVGQFDSSPALEPGVGLYVDDVYYPQLIGANFDLLDLDRVEVLRGPQGTLAGKNSIGGAIKLYAKKPEGKGTGYASVTYGNYDRIDLRASGDFSIVPDQLFVRLSAVSRSQDGYVKRLDYACTHPGTTYPGTTVPLESLQQADGCELGREGGKSYTAGRAAFRWLPTDKLEFNLSLDAINDNSERQPNVLLSYTPTSPQEDGLIRAINSPDGNPAHGFTPATFFPSDRYTSYASLYHHGGTYQSFPFVPPYQKSPVTAPDKSTYHGSGASLTFDWKLTDSLSVKSISAYREYESTTGFQDDATPLVIFLNTLHSSHHHWSQELRLNGSALNQAIDYTVGGFYFDQKTTIEQHPDLSYFVPEFVFRSQDVLPAHTKAGFVHGVWHATDELNVTLGYRYTREDKELAYTRTSPDSAPPPWTLDFFGLTALNDTTGRYEGSRSDYRASVDYHWTDDFMTYAQYSTGFKGGGVNPRPVTVNQVASFGPETLKAYEVGAKSAFWDRRVRLNAAMFFNKYKDIQLTLLACPQLGDPPGTPCFLPANTGDADVKGAELEVEVHPVEGLTIDAAGSYLHFEYTRIDSLTGVTTDMITPFTPKRKASVGVQYEIPIGTAGSVTPRIDADYTSSYFSNAVNAVANEVPSYTLVNAHLTWRSEANDWQAVLEVANVTDKLYYNNKLDYTAPGQFGTATGSPGMPRTWAVTLKRNFR